MGILKKLNEILEKKNNKKVFIIFQCIINATIMILFTKTKSETLSTSVKQFSIIL